MKKYRVWDKNFQTYECANHILLKPNGDIYNEEYDEVMNERYIIQFSTSLTDKNGKEIYEGDITVGSDYLDTVGVIKFGEHKPFDMSRDYKCGNLGFYLDVLKNKSITRKDILFWDGIGLEIIGNIYKNPELLEDI